MHPIFEYSFIPSLFVYFYLFCNRHRQFFHSQLSFIPIDEPYKPLYNAYIKYILRPRMHKIRIKEI